MLLTYSIVTPANNEADYLPGLAKTLASQTVLPKHWVIVENGSTDTTLEAAHEIANRLPWARVMSLARKGPAVRGAPIVHALNAGTAELDRTDIVVFVDADVTMEADYFERLLAEFDARPRLGIASGSGWELDGDVWKQRFLTGGSVWGATRAYRWECLADVSPLEPRHGWDGIDQLIARARGWETCLIHDLPFRHHRPEGTRDGSSWARWEMEGDTAHFLGYRMSYLVARTAFRVVRDPAAAALLVGYGRAVRRHALRLDDPGARAVLRSDQSLRNLRQRRREALGHRSARRPELPLSDATTPEPL